MISQVYPLLRRASHLGTEVPNEVQGFSSGGQDIDNGPFQVKSLTSGHEDSEWGGGLDALDAIEAHDIAA